MNPAGLWTCVHKRAINSGLCCPDIIIKLLNSPVGPSQVAERMINFRGEIFDGLRRSSLGLLVAKVQRERRKQTPVYHPHPLDKWHI